MASQNLADIFVTFLALLGPQKVLLSFARIARTLDSGSIRVVAAAAGAAATVIGTAFALTAPWIATFFHISTPALELAAGTVFFVYAVGLVLGMHFGAADEPAHVAPDAGAGPATDPLHPLMSGFREMLLPFVVSPLAVAAVLQASISARDWSGRWTVAGAFALVVLINVASALVFSELLGRVHEIVLEVLSRLLGTLLAAVGVQLFLDGLSLLGALGAPAG